MKPSEIEAGKCYAKGGQVRHVLSIKVTYTSRGKTWKAGWITKGDRKEVSLKSFAAAVGRKVGCYDDLP